MLSLHEHDLSKALGNFYLTFLCLSTFPAYDDRNQNSPQLIH